MESRLQESKVPNNMNKALWYFMILHLLRDEAENEILPWLSGSMVTLTIKYLNFCIAKMLQFRYIAPVQTAPSTIMSLLFWVALTRSVSSLYS
ncbi:unnamed protein product [Withania somnifera]